MAAILAKVQQTGGHFFIVKLSAVNLIFNIRMDQNNKVRGPIVVYTAANVTEAGLLKSELDAAGFMCEMLNVHHAALISVAPVIGVRLIVPAKQAKAALEFIKSRDK